MATSSMPTSGASFMNPCPRPTPITPTRILFLLVAMLSLRNCCCQKSRVNHGCPVVGSLCNCASRSPTANSCVSSILDQYPRHSTEVTQAPPPLLPGQSAMDSTWQSAKHMLTRPPLFNG